MTRVHPRFGTPWVAILVSAALYSALSLDSFSSLAEIDVVLYSAALVLEFVALVVLRRSQPSMARPFKIPGGMPVVYVVATVPTLALATGPIWYWVVGFALPNRKKSRSED